MSIVKIMKSTIDKTKSTTILTGWDLNLKIQNVMMNLIKSSLVDFFCIDILVRMRHLFLI